MGDERLKPRPRLNPAFSADHMGKGMTVMHTRKTNDKWRDQPKPVNFFYRRLDGDRQGDDL